MVGVGKGHQGITFKAMVGSPPRSVVVVMLSAVGDAVLVLPVVSALRRSFPGTRIIWVLQPGPHALVSGHPAVDHWVLFPRGPRGRGSRSMVRSLQALSSARRQLRELADGEVGRRFDLLLDLQVYFKAGLISALAPARIKLGFDRRRARDLNWLFTTRRIPASPTRFGHVQDQYFEFLKELEVDPEPVEYGLALSPGERESQNRFFSGLDRPACALVVASSDPRKNWNPDGYARVATELRASFGVQPILVGGHSPTEERMAAAILKRTGKAVRDERGGGLRRLLWLLEGARMAISPDTGPLHIARAVETPVVGLFGFTNPKRSGPYRLFTELLVDGYARFPDEDYGITMQRRPGGMARITAEMVLEKVALVLKPPSA